MGATWKGLCCLGAALLGLSGCWTTQPQIKPPPLREEYTLPPAAEARFNMPPEFPKEALKNGMPRRIADPAPGLPPSNRGPMPGRIGGPGVGGF